MNILSLETREIHNRRCLASALVLGCLWMGIGGAGGGVAAEASSATADAALVQPFVGEATVLVVKCDLARCSPPELRSRLDTAVPGSDTISRLWSQDVVAGIEALRAATDGQAVYVTIGIPVSERESPILFLVKETPKTNRELLLERLSAVGEWESSVRNGIVVAMPKQKTNLEAAPRTLSPAPRKTLTDAFQSIEEYPIQVLFVPPDYVRRTVTELMPELPRQLGGGPSNVLTDGLVWAALGADPAKSRVRLVIQSTSQRAAQILAAQLPKMLRSAHETLLALQESAPPKTSELLLDSAAPQVEGERLVMSVQKGDQVNQIANLLAPAAAAIRDRLLRQGNVRSFQQVLLAMHNFHDVHKAFPPGNEAHSKSINGKLSWRVHLLPFVDEQRLYEEFRLNEPWDSPHNKKLLEKMPKVYKSSRTNIAPGLTTFLAPVGEDTVFGAEKPTRFADIPDGTSNTIVLVEVKPELAVPWTAPQDYAFDPEAPERGLQIGADGRFLAGLADGSVNHLRGDAVHDVLLYLFRKSDGR